jgi:hypothetical protein
MEDVLMPCVAPRLLANSIRAGTRSIPMIVWHPLSLAACYHFSNSVLPLCNLESGTDHDCCQSDPSQANDGYFILRGCSSKFGDSACTGLSSTLASVTCLKDMT